MICNGVLVNNFSFRDWSHRAQKQRPVTRIKMVSEDMGGYEQRLLYFMAFAFHHTGVAGLFKEFKEVAKARGSHTFTWLGQRWQDHVAKVHSERRPFANDPYSGEYCLRTIH